VGRPERLERLEQDLMELISDVAFGRDPVSGLFSFLTSASRDCLAIEGGLEAGWYVIEGAPPKFSPAFRKSFAQLIDRIRGRAACTSRNGADRENGHRSGNGSDARREP
jgi:hypothetical protein